MYEGLWISSHLWSALVVQTLQTLIKPSVHKTDPEETEQLCPLEARRMSQCRTESVQGYPSTARYQLSVMQPNGQLDHVATQVTTAGSSPPPPPAAPPGPQPFLPHPCQVLWWHAPPLLHKCSLDFSQPPATDDTDQSKIAFILNLCWNKASSWELAISQQNTPLCSD